MKTAEQLILNNPAISCDVCENGGVCLNMSKLPAFRKAFNVLEEPIHHCFCDETKFSGSRCEMKIPQLDYSTEIDQETIDCEISKISGQSMALSISYSELFLSQVFVVFILLFIFNLILKRFAMLHRYKILEIQKSHKSVKNSKMIKPSPQDCITDKQTVLNMN